jgi:multiple sugar transport system substrate-binding protein
MNGSHQNLLRGITWNHTRGYLPMVATAQRFHELHPEVRIEWSVRSLQAFADESLARLADSFDLLVIDHPSIGAAAENGLILPLDEMLDRDFLEDQEKHFVGASYRSYSHNGSQWALAIDAAAPVSGWRPDLLAGAGARVPKTWEELMELARRGLVAVPGLAIDSLMHLYMLCDAVGEEPFQQRGRLVSPEVGVKALQHLRELMRLCDPACMERNPIRTWELLASSDRVAYCPFAYGYSNYSRSGFASNLIEVGDLPAFDCETPLRSVLGGAGLAISSRCGRREIAAGYAQFVAGEVCQRTLYFNAGGQPGHRSAWVDAETNRLANGFFLNTLETLDRALLRPRFNGYLELQDAASERVHRYLLRGDPEIEVLAELDAILLAAQCKQAEGMP